MYIMEKLLTRDKFRDAVFDRDNHKCVICNISILDCNLDAHHILERRLWSDGGYYLSNGATLCDRGDEGCHMKAETTEISVEDIRIAAQINSPKIPEDMYYDHVYDKWGNIVLDNGTRTKGPLFYDESVQKVLKKNPIFDTLFTDYVKYPRTHHLPWSEGITDDDRVIKSTDMFEGKRVIVTQKMDGENFSGYTGYCHARSVDGRHHYTRDWAKNFWMSRSYNIPNGWRVCAENLYAEHSIPYKNLESYLLGFSIWDNDTCLDWDSTKEWFELLEFPMVPVMYDDIYDEKTIRNLYDTKKDYDSIEGYVIRLADEFLYKDFKQSVAKFVRHNHVQTQKHWFYGKNDHNINGVRYE
jgi:hypothetical protein